jgi:hypothetical protein
MLSHDDNSCRVRETRLPLIGFARYNSLVFISASGCGFSWENPETWLRIPEKHASRRGVQKMLDSLPAIDALLSLDRTANLRLYFTKSLLTTPKLSQ